LKGKKEGTSPNVEEEVNGEKRGYSIYLTFIPPIVSSGEGGKRFS
jgi:hypothetical protein